MNYRHAYHAGNFADVMKHAVLCRVLAHLHGKPGAFCVIDTHAGAGVYDLGGAEAGKTLEWQDGIGRLMQAEHEKPVRTLLAPYLGVTWKQSTFETADLARQAGEHASGAQLTVGLRVWR